MNKIGKIWIGVFGVLLGIVIGVLIGVLVKPLPGSIDVLSFTETAFGLMIAFLAIIGGFVAVFQWSNFENRLKEAREESIKQSVEASVGAAVDAANSNTRIFNNARNELLPQITSLHRMLEATQKEIEELKANTKPKS